MKGISLSAIGQGRTLKDCFEYLAEAGYPDTSPIEIAVGPEPVLDPVIAVTPLSKSRILTGSGVLPLGINSVIDPYTDFNGIIKASWMFHLARYSMQPPTKKSVPTWGGFLLWAMRYFSAAHEAGMPFALETMYPDPANHWLASWDEVSRFLEWTIGCDWLKPIVMDVSHLRICEKAGTWNEDQIHAILESPFVAAVHFSSNDSVNDLHTPFDPAVDTDIVRWFRSVDRCDIIDEGRRDKFDYKSWVTP